MRSLTILLFLSPSFLFSQSNEIGINVTNEDGLKHGYWKIFIDSNLNTQLDSTKANWFYYGLFYHGKELFVLDKLFITEKSEDYILKIKKPKVDNSKIVPLDGSYEIYNVKGGFDKLKFNNGYIEKRLIVYDKYGDSWEKYDLNKKYNQNDFSYYYESPSATSKKIVKIHFFGTNGTIKKSKESIDFIDSRYDADSSQVLFNGYYMGQFDYSIKYLNTLKNQKGTYISENNSSNLILDTNSYFYEDYFIKIYGVQRKIDNNKVEFIADSLIRKKPIDNRKRIVQFEGIYEISYDKSKVILTRKTLDTLVKYKFTRHFYNPHISKGKIPKGPITVIAK